MIFVLWHSGGAKGEIDNLPPEWFQPNFAGSGQEHQITSVTNSEIYPAKCDVNVRGTTMLLDYGGKNKSFNEANGVDTGISRLTLNSEQPSVVVKYEWSRNRTDFREALVSWSTNKLELIADSSLFEEAEGNRVLVSHYQRERAHGLASRKIKHVKESGGDIKCEACKFSFEENFGEIGSDFCEVHHRNPLANGPRATSLDDLALLCANCHRMIHRVFSRSGRAITVANFAATHLR